MSLAKTRLQRRRGVNALLVYPRDPNPYQESLYEALAAGAGITHRYVGELSGSQTLNLLLLPLELFVRRLAGYRCLHLHWLFKFVLPGSRRFPSLRRLARWQFTFFLVWSRLLGIKIVWTAHNVLPHQQVFDDDARARRALTARSVGVIAHHEATLDALRALGCRLRRTAVIPHGMPQPRSRVDAVLPRPAGDLAPAVLTGVFVGNVEAYKGVEDLLAATADARVDGISLVIAGECRDAHLAAALRRLAHASRVPVMLRLVRLSDDELRDLLESADFAVLPYRAVTSSGTVGEVLGAGCPVVLPEFPGLSGVPAGCCWRYDGTIAGLAATLERVVGTTAAERKLMAAAACEYAADNSWANVGAETARFLVATGALEPPVPCGARPASAHRGPGPFHSVAPILSGFTWNSIGQLVLLGINIGLTPFLIHRLGLDRYGLYALISAFLGLVSNLDGGLGASATRYFSVHVGADDRSATSRLLFTLSTLLVAGVGLIALIVELGAPLVTPHLHATRSLANQATLLVRALMPLLLASMVRDVVQSLLAAHHRWRSLNVINTAGNAVYAVLAVALVGRGLGLVGLIWAYAGSELVISVGSLICARRDIDIRSLRLMPMGDIREYLRYSSRVQVTALTNMVNTSFDVVVVGIFLPVHFVALYSIGANFCLQVRALPMSAFAPIQVSLARTYGESGLSRAVEEFQHLQRLWVQCVVIVPLAGAAAALFAIPRWLGTNVREAGVIAAILLVGQAVNLLTGPLNSLATSVNRPDVERDYGLVAMASNALLTLCLIAPFGVVGVAAGTAIGSMIGSGILVKLARKRIRRDLRNFFAEVPWLALLGPILLTVAAEIPAYRLAHQGVLGLCLCAVPALLGLALYFGLVLPDLRATMRAEANLPLSPITTTGSTTLP